jgi:hypothetical protein
MPEGATIFRAFSAWCSVIIGPMTTNREQFVVDESGNRTAVLLEIDRYSELLEAQEELDAIRAFDEAKASNEEPIPFAQAIREIEGS